VFLEQKDKPCKKSSDLFITIGPSLNFNDICESTQASCVSKTLAKILQNHSAQSMSPDRHRAMQHYRTISSKSPKFGKILHKDKNEGITSFDFLSEVCSLNNN